MPIFFYKKKIKKMQNFLEDDEKTIPQPLFLQFENQQEFVGTPLVSIIEKNSINFKQILEHPQIFRLVYENNFSVINYVVAHCDDLLKVCFDENDKNHSSAAFFIIRLSNKKITEAISQSNVLYKECFHLLSKDDADVILDETMLIRICTVTELILINYEDMSNKNDLKSNENSSKYHVFPPSCGFIVQLFPFMHEFCVISFFVDLLEDREGNKLAQTWMKEMEFSQIVCNELNKITPKGDPYIDKKTQAYMNLLRIIRKGVRCTLLKDSFLIDNVIQAVLRKIDENIPFADDERVCTIVELYNEQTFVKLRCVFDELHLIVKQQKNDKIGRKVTAALIILTKMLMYDKIEADVFSEFHFEVDILHILFERTDSSILVNTALLFATTAMEHKDLIDVFVNTLFPPIIYEFKSEKTNPTLKEIAFQLLTWSKDKSSSDKILSKALAKITGYKQIISQMKKYKKMREPDPIIYKNL